MIKYEWRDQLSHEESAEIAGLLERAAEHDAETEYSTIDFADVQRAMRDESPTSRHLVIWMLPHAVALDLADEPERIAGILRLNRVSETAAEATIVVDPRCRSIGIATSLLEQTGLDTEDPHGWLGTGARCVTGWARGNHPAAERLSNRFVIPRTRRVWKLIRPVCRTDDGIPPDVETIDDAAFKELDWAGDLPHGNSRLALRDRGRIVGVAGLNLNPVMSAEFGSCATIQRTAIAPDADATTQRRLLDGAAAALGRDFGFSGVCIYVDSSDAALVHSCRLAGFQHDRTDVRYQLGGV